SCPLARLAYIGVLGRQPAAYLEENAACMAAAVERQCRGGLPAQDPFSPAGVAAIGNRLCRRGRLRCRREPEDGDRAVDLMQSRPGIGCSTLSEVGQDLDSHVAEARATV